MLSSTLQQFLDALLKGPQAYTPGRVNENPVTWTGGRTVPLPGTPSAGPGMGGFGRLGVMTPPTWGAGLWDSAKKQKDWEELLEVLRRVGYGGGGLPSMLAQLQGRVRRGANFSTGGYGGGGSGGGGGGGTGGGAGGGAGRGW